MPIKIDTLKEYYIKAYDDYLRNEDAEREWCSDTARRLKAVCDEIAEELAKHGVTVECNGFTPEVRFKHAPVDCEAIAAHQMGVITRFLRG